MADLATAYVQIIPTTKGIKGELEGALGDEAESAGKSAGGRFGNGMKKAGKFLSGVAIAGTAAIAGLSKSAVSSYAEYEQLIGGVETLFGTQGMTIEQYAQSVGKSVSEVQDKYASLSSAQEAVFANAADAYMNAGLSANDYMDQVNSTAASMVSSLGGDTEKAAELANQAIIDMSDNANKMGTSIDSIQNAYGGFAKGNFTMLDNLKLGYGGTKAEMERLLEDAEKLSGVHYDISSYADITEAIHVMQKEMGIAGTTAKEAQGTISGSLGMLKASWENMMVGMADDNADFDGLMNQLVTSLETVGSNLLPIIEKTLVGAVNLIEGLAPKIIEILPGLIESLIPAVIGAVKGLVNAVVHQLPGILQAAIKAAIDVLKSIGDMMPELVPSLVDMMTQIVDVLIDNAPMLLEAAIAIMVGLGEGLINSLPTIIQKIPELIDGIIQALVAAIPMLIEAGIQLFVALVENLPAIIEGIVAAIPEIIAAILEGLASLAPALGALFQGAWEFIVGVWNVAVGFFQGIWDGISAVFSVVGEVLSGFFQGAWDLIQGIWSVVVSFFSGVWNGIVSVFSGVASFFTGVFQAAWNGITSIFNKLGSFFSGVWNAVVSIFRDAGVAVGDAISGAVRGAVNAILGGATSIINGFISAINFAIAVINAIPGVSISPIGYLSAPALARGGILERGEVGLLEGTGAEAVVPLDQNRAWIHAVTMDFMSELQNQYALGRSIAGSSVGGSAYSEGVDNTWNNGDIIIPVSIGGRQIERIVVEADRINALRTGGR